LIYSMCIWIAFPNFPICPMKSRFPKHQMMFFLVKYDVPNCVTITMPKVQ
jgi:hypothetical protein